MKKLIALLLALVMVLGLSACGGEEPKKDDGEKEGVVQDKDNNKNDDKDEDKDDEGDEQDDVPPVLSDEISLENLMNYPASPEEDFGWSQNEDGEKTCSVYNYSGDDEILVIPETINGYTVTRITGYAFANSSPVKAVRLPDSVIALEDSCFGVNKNLEIIVFGSGVRKVGSKEGGVFQGCENLKTVVLNEGLEEIKGFAFASCDSLTSIEIPDTVTEITITAFYGPSDGLVIIGSVGSAAEQYANKKDINFQAK